MRNPLVIGYKGEIGSYILQGLLSCMPKASNIWCVDVNSDEQEVKSRIDIADVIFLCVPIDKTIEFFNEYRFFLRGKIVIEQTSVKLWVTGMKDELKQTYGCDLVSMHILFRPSSTPDRKDHYIAVVGSRQTPGLTYAKNFIDQALKAKLVYIMTIDEHETMMACQQALVHRVLLVLDECLRSEFPGTYISRRVRELANRISQGDPILYSMIQENPKLKLQLDNFNRKMREFRVNKKKYFKKKEGQIRS